MAAPHVQAKRPHSPLVTVLFFAAVTLTLYSAMSPRFLPFEKQFTALLYLAPYVLLLTERRARVGRFVLALLLFTPPLLLGTLFQVQVIPANFASSIATIYGILGYYLSARAGVDYGSRTGFTMLIGGLLLAALMAPAFPDRTDFNRFEPPAFLLLSFAIVLAVKAPRLKLRAMATGLLLLLLMLGVFSQWRFSPLSALLVLGGFYLISRTGVALLIALSAIFLLGILEIAGVMPTLEITSSNRLAAVLDPAKLIEELGVRALEVRDVIAFSRTQGNLMTTLFGFGHGANFFADSTITAFEGVAQSSWKWRFDENSLAYTVHFGPARIFFRYGIFGLACVCYLGWRILRSFFGLARRDLRDRQDLMFATATLALTFYLMRFFLQPVEHELLLMLSLALFASGLPRRTGKSRNS